MRETHQPPHLTPAPPLAHLTRRFAFQCGISQAIEQHAATVRFKRQEVFSSITPRHGVGAGIELSQCLALVLAERDSGLHASSFHCSVCDWSCYSGNPRITTVMT